MLKKLVLVTLALMMTSEVFASSESRRFLLSSLQTRANLGVKIASVKSLRDFAGQNDVERALLNLIQNGNEPVALRQAAMESLVPFTRSSNLTRRIMAQYTREFNPAMKRTILRSLWLAAASNSNVERFLLRVANTEFSQELKEAAVFGLQATVNSSTKARNMMTLVLNRTLSPSLRLEALKSLFFYKNNRVEDMLEHIIVDRTELPQMRAASLRMLMTYPVSSSKRRFIMNVANTAFNRDVKIAAVDALRTMMNQEDVRFFHLYKNPKTGEMRNPLLD